MDKIIGIIMILFLPPLFVGGINKIKAILAGRKGSSIFQVYYDLKRQLKKSEVPSETTTWVFYIFPIIYLATIITAGLLLPVIGHNAVIDFSGSFILFVYILALGKFVMIAGAMDTGSSFEGMGASREAFFTSFLEPVIFMMFGSISIFASDASFNSMFLFFKNKNELLFLVVLLCIFIMGIIMFVEGCRIPIDDPETHLELTMIHEVMILDNSGPSLGIIQYASAVKLFMFATLTLNFIIPYGLPVYVYVIVYLLEMFLVAFVIGIFEAILARFRMVRIPEFLFSLVAMAIMVMFVVVIYYYGGK